MFEPISNHYDLKIVVLKNTNHCSTRSQIVYSNSEREIVLGYHAIEVNSYGFLSRKVSPHADVINNVNARILNISQDKYDNNISVIETEVKIAIVTRVTGNEEREFNFRVT